MALNENAKKWVAALRSGEFAQGQHFLRKHDNYCCLGVACELYRRETGNGEWWQVTQGKYTFISDSYEFVTVLPSTVAYWLGLHTEAGEFGVEDSLADMNDTGKTFDEIADVIESEPVGLFV